MNFSQLKSLRHSGDSVVETYKVVVMYPPAPICLEIFSFSAVNLQIRAKAQKTKPSKANFNLCYLKMLQR